MYVYVCVSQAGRDRKGRARRSHRVRTDVVLTALKGEMPKKGLGGGCPLGHTAVTNNKNSNNTHHHQSGHSHSALDLEEPLLGGGRAGWMMRYLCGPGGQHNGVNSGTGLETERRVNGTSGLTQPAPDSAPCHNTEQSMEVAPRVRVWVEVAGQGHRKAASLLGFLRQGRGLGQATIPYPGETIIIIKCPGRFPGPGGPVSSEAPEESLF